MQHDTGFGLGLKTRGAAHQLRHRRGRQKFLACCLNVFGVAEAVRDQPIYEAIREPSKPAASK